MLITDIKNAIKDINLPYNTLLWISAGLVAILISLGSYAFFFKKDAPDTKNYITFEQFNKIKVKCEKLILKTVQLQEDVNDLVGTVNSLSTNTDKRLLYIVKKVEHKQDIKDDIGDVIDMTKVEKLTPDNTPTPTMMETSVSDESVEVGKSLDSNENINTEKSVKSNNFKNLNDDTIKNEKTEPVKSVKLEEKITNNTPIVVNKIEVKTEPAQITDTIKKISRFKKVFNVLFSPNN
jgi:hypothetical protein